MFWQDAALRAPAAVVVLADSLHQMLTMYTPSLHISEACVAACHSTATTQHHHVLSALLFWLRTWNPGNPKTTHMVLFPCLDVFLVLAGSSS
jgi:hypothetical protein